MLCTHQMINFIYIIISIRYFHFKKTLIANLIKKVLKSINFEDEKIILFQTPNPLKRNNSTKDEGIPPKIFQRRKKKFNTVKGKYKRQDMTEISINTSKKIISIVNESKFKNSNLIQKDSANSKNNKKIKKQRIKNENINYYNDSELNSLDYNDAVTKDKRSYFQYYCSLIRTKHLIFFTFFINNDYNLREVKFGLFLISFSLYFSINAFFFVDENIHQIYEDYGMFNFIYEFPRIIYSSLITIVCNLIIKALALSENTLLKIKKKENKIQINKECVYLYTCLRNKIIIFYIVGYCLLLFCWYFTSAFCAVYKNTQIIYLKNCSISFCLSMVYPFLYYLIPGLFRISSLKDNKRKNLYIIANILAKL